MDTLNRLLHKNEKLANSTGAVFSRASVPRFTQAMLTATRESWSLEQLLLARRPDHHNKQNPKCDTCPILAIEVKGHRFLLDGGTRLNRREQNREVGPHSVVFIKPKP